MTRKPTDKNGPKQGDTARYAAKILRAHIMSLGEDVYLGSEDDIVELLGISRPTVRQVTRILEHEQLLKIKRGPGGGFYTRRPNIESLTHAASIHLLFEKASMFDVIQASIPLMEDAVRRTAESDNKTLRNQLRRLLDDYREQLETTPAIGAQHQFETAMMDLVTSLAGNPVTKLILSMLYDFGISQTSVRIFDAPGKNLDSWRRLALEIGEAILAKDTEQAVALWQRRTAIFNEWMARSAKHQLRKAGSFSMHSELLE